MSGTGTITTYTPGSDYIMFRGEAECGSGEVLLHQDHTSCGLEGAHGRMVSPASGHAGELHLREEGDRMVVPKMTVQKPVADYEKTTTTTTTTKP